MNKAHSDESPWLPAPARPALGTGEVHLWRVWLAGPDAFLAQMRGRLDAEELGRVNRLVFPEHRRRSLIARVALRDVLARYAGRAPGELVFEAAPGGKPFLDARCDGARVRFNMTHSGDLMLAAVAGRREVGVDVEQVRDRVARERLAERYFAPQEAAELRALPEGERREAFFRCWTRKEAYIKALGVGLALPLRSFCVPVRPDAPMRLTTAEEPGGIARWTLHNLDPAEGFVGALVMEGAITGLRRYEWKCEEGA